MFIYCETLDFRGPFNFANLKNREIELGDANIKCVML